MTGAWVCEACAKRLQLPPGGGPSYAGGMGWCGAGQHRTGPGERIVWHDRVAEVEVATAVAVAPAATGHAVQLELL